MFLSNRRKQVVIQPIQFPNDLPNGICIEFETNKYLVKKNKLWKFYSDRAWKSWGVESVLVKPPPLPRGGTLGFRDGTLIQNAKDGRIYLVSDARRRLVTRPLEDYGFDWSQVVEASNDEIEIHLEGEDI